MLYKKHEKSMAATTKIHSTRELETAALAYFLNNSYRCRVHTKLNKLTEIEKKLTPFFESALRLNQTIEAWKNADSAKHGAYENAIMAARDYLTLCSGRLPGLLQEGCDVGHEAVQTLRFFDPITYADCDMYDHGAKLIQSFAEYIQTTHSIAREVSSFVVREHQRVCGPLPR